MELLIIGCSLCILAVIISFIFWKLYGIEDRLDDKQDKDK